MNDYLVITLADERCRCYREGQISYDRWEPAARGWVVNDIEGADGPTEAFRMIAQVAAAAYLAGLDRVEKPKYLPRD